MIQAFLPEMLERNKGSLVALSSCAGLFGLPNLVPYCGTKFAVRGYMAALTEELRQKNPQCNVSIPCNCVSVALGYARPLCQYVTVT